MMRWFLVIALLATGLAGCLDSSSSTEEPGVPGSFTDTPRERMGLSLADLPEVDAEIQETEAGFQLIWDRPGDSFDVTIPIPEGATMASIDVVGREGVGYSAAISHAETGRRRCNTQPLLSFSESVVGGQRCSGVTLIDHPNEPWRFRGSGAGIEQVVIELIGGPVDGFAGTLNLGAISKLDYEIEETQYLRIPSFDGTMLWVEYTKPVGEGPFPTIISSSPYNNGDRSGTEPTPAMWAYWTQDWAKRGYVAVNADVRGFGESDGCVEVWGYREQLDQVHLVEWIAEQDWSDGNVGFYGQSYLGTTAMEAAVYAPEALKAIVTIAPVATAYHDWHYGGVRNLEALASPAVGYQVGGASTVLRPEDPVGTAIRTIGGLCDVTLSARSNDPRAIYDQFYIERDFAARATDIEAAVLYTQGFEDANVKGAMIPFWFNDLQSPKLGLFGHWLHQHPPRMDEEVLFMAWMDQFVKGKEMGLGDTRLALVNPNPDQVLVTSQWPNPDAPILSQDLAPTQLILDPAGVAGASTYDLAIDEGFSIDGVVELELHGQLIGTANAYVGAYLYDVTDGGRNLLTWGQFNLAHRYGFDVFTPVLPTEDAFGTIEFLPTSFTFPEGAQLELELRGVTTVDNLYPLVQAGLYDVQDLELRIPNTPLEAFQDAGYTHAP